MSASVKNGGGFAIFRQNQLHFKTDTVIKLIRQEIDKGAADAYFCSEEKEELWHRFNLV